MAIELENIVKEVIEQHARAIVSALLGKEGMWSMDNELRQVVKDGNYIVNSLRG